MLPASGWMAGHLRVVHWHKKSETTNLWFDYNQRIWSLSIWCEWDVFTMWDSVGVGRDQMAHENVPQSQWLALRGWVDTGRLSVVSGITDCSPLCSTSHETIDTQRGFDLIWDKWWDLRGHYLHGNTATLDNTDKERLVRDSSSAY